MDITPGKTVAVVVKRDWANLVGVRMLLRQYQSPEIEIEGTDESHLILAKVLDSEDPKGLWIELNTERHRQDPTVKTYAFLIPWSQLVGMAIAGDFSQAINEEARRIGFTVQTTEKDD